MFAISFDISAFHVKQIFFFLNKLISHKSEYYEDKMSNKYIHAHITIKERFILWKEIPKFDHRAVKISTEIMII
jgi:hypothetical protein